MKYCVITLDLVNSRQLPDREKVQKKFKEVLKLINQKYAGVIKVPFDFTLGDEVQGVLASLKDSYPLIRDFQRIFQTYPFYAGVGYGEILTRLSGRSGEMDGPAFHLARASIERLKEGYIRSHGRFVPLVRYTFQSPELTSIVNNYIQMVELLKFKLTDKQREVYWLLFETGTYREIAERLKQSKSAITQKIQAGYVEEIRAGEDGLIQLLEWIERKEM
ncbi:SatD family protein [Anoxybacter fermentans]|nr:SatD family protein [Anoxybacter fermentans]